VLADLFAQGGDLLFDRWLGHVVHRPTAVIESR
jgi:hypothetical protein